MSISLISIPIAQSSVSGGQIALIAVIVTVTAVMLTSAARKRREAGPSPRALFREHREQRREEKAVHSDVADIMLQLQQVAREVSAQLDAKFLRLEQCLDQADERIERLQELTGRAGAPGCSDGSTGTPPLDETLVLKLARKGKSPVEIAETVGRPAGEVDLVLSLHRAARRAASDKPATGRLRSSTTATS